MSQIFETFIMICIIANIIIMAMTYDSMSTSYEATLDTISTVFSFIFLFEAIVKIIALGAKNYFS
jgi:biotin transporter BioY